MIKMMKKRSIWSFNSVYISMETYSRKRDFFFPILLPQLKKYGIKSVCSGCGSEFEENERKYSSNTMFNKTETIKSFNNLKKQRENDIYNEAVANLDETMRLELLNTFKQERLTRFHKEKKVKKREICKRCHNLVHHSTLSTEFPILPQKLSSANWLSIFLKEKNPLLICIIDSVDFPHSYISELHNLYGKISQILYVINKIDIICTEKDMLNKIRDYFVSEISKLTQIAEEQIKPFIILTSATKGWGIDQLITSINKYKTKKSNIYFIGMANVGKSSIISRFASQAGYEETPTVSFLPGTTLNPINIDMNKLRNLFKDDGIIIDTPGISEPNRQLFKHIECNKLKFYIPKKRFPKIKPFSIKAGQSLIIEKIVRIDYIDTLKKDNRLIVTPYTFLPIHITNRKKAEHIFKTTSSVNNMTTDDKTSLNETKILYYNLTESIEHKKHKDIVIAGFGWITARINYGSANIKIFSLESKGVVLRNSLMQYIASQHI
ncbi:hypothetical protein T552_01766 [Pneumocystis carinii B80]|uniref:G domain-containing protein n=1 Tax=Pneumocystis carinii (strain B80) TaxID=1408658 RepID=A0A0W4ZJF6_PNEC8|nr:hypothetical protein T552_01766 [Pneumocystis carinii B80]KTW28507.1 hypothetical protein T552_01766 [Pneumocystis carinii B80]